LLFEVAEVLRQSYFKMFCKLLFVTEIEDRENLYDVNFKNQSGFTEAFSCKTPGT